jgi:hypothetical protein
MRHFSIFIILIVFTLQFTGCITKRGTKVDTSNLIQLPNGTWKIRPLPKANPKLNIEPVKQPLPESKPIKLTPIEVKPTPTTASSVIAEIEPIEIKPAGVDSSPFAPTVSTTPQKLPPFPVVTLPENDENKEPEIANPPEITQDSSLFTVNWIKLFAFYAFCILVLVMAYLVYIKKKPVLSPPQRKAEKRKPQEKNKNERRSKINK